MLKKGLLFLLGVFLLTLILSNLSNLRNLSQEKVQSQKPKKPILRIALVADSENENELLADSLRQAQGKGVNFVIGLGDWSDVGTVGELTVAKEIFEKSKIPYFLTAGDHDLWDSRNRGLMAITNFKQVFGEPTQVFERENVLFVILDNSDIYSGISQSDWEILTSNLGDLGYLSNLSQERLTFVFAHKTPFHPESKHVMGEDSPEVAKQAQELLAILEEAKVDGFFSGDLHFFAKYQSPRQSVKITTIGAVASQRNFQGPHFSILTVFDDWSWEVEDVEIR